MVELLAPSLALFGGEFPGDIDRLADSDGAGAKGQGNLKAVPALKGNLAGEVVSNGENRQTGELGQGDDARVNLITGAAGTVGRDRDIQTLRGAGIEFDQGLGSAAAAGAADRDNVVKLQDAGKHSAIAAGTDQGGHFALGLSFDHVDEIAGQGEKEAVMPDAENHVLWLGRGSEFLHVVVDRVNAEADGCGEEARDAEDEPGHEPAVPACFLGLDDAGCSRRGG